ncbi:MAG TPA: phytoene/squalene synthase family protein [Bryobacteraceae bacterium]|jgi:phytoene synthase|nr:phytoene/squalene synthase family protein [Bryobacteraceae bacterium]
MTVAQSYQYCERIAKARAKNFYYSFLLLDKHQRGAMCAVYAFMRHCDDLSDDPGMDLSKRWQAIAEWRLQLDRALAGETDAHAIWPAFHASVQRYKIPHRYFHEMIDGVLSDLETVSIRTFEELYQYCYRVASVVGLTVVHIFGFRSTKALILAEKCGIAFQLTNILRDVREDAEMGRYYIPEEDLARFGVTREQLRAGCEDDRFRALMRFEADRARSYYEVSAPLLDLISPKSRRSLWALRAIYMKLLDKIERSGYSVLTKRISVSKSGKIALLLRALLPK